MPASGTYPHTRRSSDIRDNLAQKFAENSFFKPSAQKFLRKTARLFRGEVCAKVRRKFRN